MRCIVCHTKMDIESDSKLFADYMRYEYRCLVCGHTATRIDWNSDKREGNWVLVNVDNEELLAEFVSENSEKIIDTPTVQEELGRTANVNFEDGKYYGKTGRKDCQ